MSETTAIVQTAEPVQLGVLRATQAAELIAAAEAVATPLARLIRDRQLAVEIQGKQYVRCEGWTTLAAMLGVTPHEVEVREHGDGIFTATVELRRLSDGMPVARASAECGAPDEEDRNGKPVWANRPRYARRSMALTRATAKACRMAFSWIMVLAGYEATPAEEITPVVVERKLPTVIPFGRDRGKPLRECSSEHLSRIKAWCLEKQRFSDLVDAIDEILEERRAQDAEKGQDQYEQEDEDDLPF